MVFSSSCTVYGEPAKVPIDETFPRKAVSPYGNTKLVIEDIMTGNRCRWWITGHLRYYSPEVPASHLCSCSADYSKADKEWRIILLRYFNPVGAHPSGKLSRPA